ncbi:uncharacterized protein LOC118438629 [Folsomia candida]|nr:uncharacterized protein LOC118438629 [Folsomia candida]
MFGGNYQGYDLLAFDMETYNYSIISNMTQRYFKAAAITVGNRAYIFDDYGFGRAVELDLDTFTETPVGPSTLPDFNSAAAVWDGDNASYIFGGYPPSAGRTDGIFQFSPTSYESSFIPVENWPLQSSSYFMMAPASVFVLSMNRIYCFGGYSYNGTSGSGESHNSIFYMDMTPLDASPTTEQWTTEDQTTTNFPTTTRSTTTADFPSTTDISTTTGIPTTTETSTTTDIPTTTEIPTTTDLPNTTDSPIATTTLNPDFFTCRNRSDGMYPHPADCSQFIGCRSEELTIFQCPTPLLFDPIQKSCQPPEEVECRTSCIDRPNGEYPHPHDCSLFIICRDGDANLYKCPPPLLFDPILSACNFPDDVDCYSVKHIFDRN